MQLIINKLHIIYIRTAVPTSGFRDRPIYLGNKPISVPVERVLVSILFIFKIYIICVSIFTFNVRIRALPGHTRAILA